jgi:hypothetical protein
METQNKTYNTLNDFWPFYLSEHSHPVNRRLHFIGSTFSLIFMVMAILSLDAYFLLAGLFSGYGFAWIGHFVVEKNTPATFKYPLKSFVSDWRMYISILTFQIDKEMEKYSIKNK